MSGIPISIWVDVLTACGIPLLCGILFRNWIDGIAVGMSAGFAWRVIFELMGYGAAFGRVEMFTQAHAAVFIGLVLSACVWATIGHAIRRSVLAIGRYMRRARL